LEAAERDTAHGGHAGSIVQPLSQQIMVEGAP
jgi:hypothetical protein